MNLKQLFTDADDERAVSPVIGVILMVAITVILAAVIGTFVLGLGDQVQQTSPNAQWEWEGSQADGLNLTHTSGDSVEASTLEVTGDPLDDTGPYCVNGEGFDGNWTDSTITAGSECGIASGNVTSSGTARLIWTAEGGGSSSTLTDYEVE